MKDPKKKSKMKAGIYILVCLAVIVSGVIFFFDPYIARFGMWTIVQRNKMAAERGDIDAMLELATLYSIGHYIKRDVPETVKWLRKAAELGNAKAQYELGFYYDVGDGVPQDLAEAVNWWHRAAEQGNMDAQNHIGACYAEFLCKSRSGVFLKSLQYRQNIPVCMKFLFNCVYKSYKFRFNFILFRCQLFFRFLILLKVHKYSEDEDCRRYNRHNQHTRYD